MGIFDKIMKAQNSFDDKVIGKLKEDWKKKLQILSREELQAKLIEIEPKEKFDSTKSSKKLFSFDPFASSKHIISRDLEAQIQAIHELLRDKE